MVMHHIFFADCGSPERRPLRGTPGGDWRLPLKPQLEVLVLRVRLPDQKQQLQTGKKTRGPYNLFWVYLWKWDTRFYLKRFLPQNSFSRASNSIYIKRFLNLF